jgi:prepilin peptidase CpaA
MALVPLLLMAPVLIAVAYCDMRYMRIPNMLSLIAIGIFVVTAPLIGWPEAGLRLAVAAVVFILGFIAFAFRLFGGGDIKMLSALMLFVPTQTLALYAYVFSAAMLIGIVFILSLRAGPWFRDSSWISMQAKGKFPMGISIALSGLLHPAIVAALSLS